MSQAARALGSAWFARALGCAGAVVLAASVNAEGTSPQPSPRLVVVITIDQLGADLFERWRPRFDAGLAKLAGEGVVYANAYQSHGLTDTCPGHATLSTGRHPAGSGLVANVWYDAAAAREVDCVDSQHFVLAHDTEAPGIGPDHLTASTLGEWLKTARPESRIVAVSGKDRAAVAMAGRSADAVFWYADDYGFTTYAEPGDDRAARLAPLAGFNDAVVADWRQAPPVWRYADARCRMLETEYRFADRVWRSGLPPQEQANGTGDDAARLRASPFLDELTLDAARTLIEHYRLGQRAAVDLLAVGLAATDYIGHRFGTQGPEMCDQLGRLDRMLDAFLAELEALGVPLLVVMTADHGGLDFPERLRAHGHPQAERLDPETWLQALNSRLESRFELTHAPVIGLYGGLNVTQLYLVDADGAALAQPLRGRVKAAALQWLDDDAEVQAAFARSALAALPPPPSATPPDELSLEQRLAQSVHPERSGDLLVAFRPWVLPYRAVPGVFVAGHGSPYDYDRRVPVVFWRPGLRPHQRQERRLPIATVDIAPTLAGILGLRPPADLDGRCRPLDGFGGGSCSP